MDIPSNKNTISIPIKEIGHTLTAEEFNKVVDAITSNKYDIYSDTVYCKSGVYATGNTLLENAQVENARITEQLSVFMVDKYNDENNSTKADLSFETLCNRVTQLKNSISELAAQSIDQETIMNALRPTLNQYVRTSVYESSMNQIQSRFSSIDADIADIRANGGGSGSGSGSGTGSGSGSGSGSGTGSGSNTSGHIDPATQTDEYNFIKSLDFRVQKFKIYKPAKEDLDFGAWMSGTGKTWAYISSSVDFPSVALVGYTQSSIVIYDISAPSKVKKWYECNVHKFITGNESSLSLQISCIAVKNGIVAIGVSNSADGYTGILELNFSKDTIRFFGNKGGFNTMILLNGIGTGFSSKTSNNVSENYNFTSISDINIFVDDMLTEDMATGKKFVKYAVCDSSKLKIIDQKNYEYKIYESQSGIQFTSTWFDQVNGKLYATTVSDGIYIFTSYTTSGFVFNEFMKSSDSNYGIKHILFNTGLKKCIVTDTNYYICYSDGFEIVNRANNSSLFTGTKYCSGIVYNNLLDTICGDISRFSGNETTISMNYNLQMISTGQVQTYPTDLKQNSIQMNEGAEYDIVLNTNSTNENLKFCSLNVKSGTIFIQYSTTIRDKYIAFWKKNTTTNKWNFIHKRISSLNFETDGISTEAISPYENLIFGTGEFAFIKITSTSMTTAQQNEVKNYENNILNVGTGITYLNGDEISNYSYEKLNDQFFIAMKGNTVAIYKNGSYSKTLTFNENDTISWFDWNFGFLGYTSATETKVMSSKEYVTSTSDTINKTEIVNDLSDYISSVFSPIIKADVAAMIVQYNRNVHKMDGSIRFNVSTMNANQLIVPPYTIAVHDKIVISNEERKFTVLSCIDDSEKNTFINTGALAGKDFYIWLTYDNAIFITSVSAANPSSFNKDRAVIIGGFHCLCEDISNEESENGHPLRGFVAGTILPQSVWCENNRPSCSPIGMFKDINGLNYWYDIYPSSVKNLDMYESVYKPDEYPSILPDSSISTGDPWIIASKMLAGAGKTMLSSELWYSAGYGTPEGTAINARKTGGHKTVGNRRLVSYGGGEGFSGYKWQFLSDSLLYSAGMNDTANSNSASLPGNKLVHYVGADTYFFFNDSWWKQGLNDAIPTKKDDFISSDTTNIQNQLIYSSDRHCSYLIPSKSVLCRMLAGGISLVKDIQDTSATVHSVNTIYSRAIIDYQNTVFPMNEIAIRGCCISK